MSNTNSIALLPLDNRPVSYLLPKQIANFSGISLILPERKYLGDLITEADLCYLKKWLKELLDISTLIISLDNWVYGGLVQSRKHTYSLEELRSHVDLLRSDCEGLSQQTPITIYGFSSIMRIPNYNNSDEEKDYWKDYGETIFKWSELMHKVGRGIKGDLSNEELIEEWYQSSKRLPVDVLVDYKSHRDKNFSINMLWLELLHNNYFKYLIFSCDDSAKYGMNVIEAEYLKDQINKHRFSHLAKVISGTDEIPLVLLTKAVLEQSTEKPLLSIYFNSNTGKDQISRYESDSIHKSILNQIETLELNNVELTKEDIVLCVHCADSVQGDHIFKNIPDNTKNNVVKFIEFLKSINKPFIILDLAYANGADPLLIESLLNANINWQNCYGYSGWNTTSNSTGSVLAIGINRWLAEKKNRFNHEEFKKCLLARFLDDYAYQTQIRHPKIKEEETNNRIKPFVKDFSKILDLDNISVKCTLPWKRSFEVEIDINVVQRKN